MNEKMNESQKNRQKLRRWEISLLIGTVCALLVGAVKAQAQNGLKEKLIRLHVVAASDNQEDQALKLQVRDRTLEILQKPLSGVDDPKQAAQVIRENLPALEEGLQTFVQEQGSDQTVRAELTQNPFPTKDYGTFALPAGKYNALRVVLGEGRGQNWWCVVFPPLCTATAMEELEDTSRQAGLTEEELGLITQENEEYVIKFKFLEWLGNLQNKWG